MSRQVSGGSAGDYQADEQAGVARLNWRHKESDMTERLTLSPLKKGKQNLAIIWPW